MVGGDDREGGGEECGSRGDFAAARDLKVQLKEQRLTIEWADGRRSEYALAALRRACPCASCRTERDQQAGNPLRILKADPTGIHVVQAELVGKYAIRLVWSDGHDAGIFDFRFLRSLDRGSA